MWEDQELLASERELESLAQYQPDPADEAFEAWLASLEPAGGGDEPPPAAPASSASLRRAPRGLAAAIAAALLVLPASGCGGAPLAPVAAVHLSGGSFDPLAPADRGQRPKHPRKVKVAAEQCPGLSRVQCAASLEYNACIRSMQGCSDEQLTRDFDILFGSGGSQ